MPDLFETVEKRKAGMARPSFAAAPTPPQVEHYPGCTADYPEKVAGESPQQLTTMDLGDGEAVLQCVDCGAHVLVPSQAPAAAVEVSGPPVAATPRVEPSGGDSAQLIAQLAASPFTALLGGAGTGKTFALKEWMAGSEVGQLALCATTGIAAVNLGEGTTLNATLKYFDTASLTEMYTSGYLQARLRKMRRAGLQRILLDEVSMLDGNQLTILVRALDEINGAGGYDLEESAEEDEHLPPLGLTVVGDFCQLPPVKAPFAFESPEWDRFTVHSLSRIWRQTDVAFIEALRAARRGDGDAAVDVLAPCFAQHTDPSFDGPTLLATNEAVDRYNRLRMDTLKGSPHRLVSSRWGQQRSEWKQIPETLELKEGALVMVLANSYDQEAERYRYVNGDLGEFLGVSNRKASVRLQRTGEIEEVSFIQREVTEPLEVGERKAMKLAGEQDKIKEKSKITGAVTYMPLRVAYATTVHKCVAADTRVPVHGKGYVPINDLQLGDVTPWGAIRNRVRTTQWAFRVTTKRGYSVVCSADHRWSTREGWKETKDLVVGTDDIELNSGIPFPGEDSLGPTKAWLLGVLVGDGCYTDQRDGTVHFACSHFVFGEQVRRAMQDAFDIEPKWRSDERGLWWTSKTHRADLQKLGLEYVKAPSKTVPPIIWTLGPRDRAAFLAGLFDTDGHIGRNRVILTTASVKLAEEVQELLLTLGIVCKRSCYPGVKDSTYWQLFVGAESVDRFQRFVGFRHPDKQEKLFKTRPNRVLRPTNGYDRIVAVTSLALELPMVDVELDAPHTVAFGPFIGHNSQGLSLDKVQINLREGFMGTGGMLYVSLSRARSLAGLRVIGSPATFIARCVTDKRVTSWI